MVLDAAKLKTMTGGDTITARFLHENDFEFRPEFKLTINTNKERTQLKDSKKTVVAKIVAHEDKIKAEAEAKAAEKKTDKKQKRSNKTYEFNGKVQTLAEWSAELGIAESTLYGRIHYRNNSIEEAFTSSRSNRSNKTYEFDGRHQTLDEWSKELGIATSTLYGRIHYRNKTVAEAFTMKK